MVSGLEQHGSSARPTTANNHVNGRHKRGSILVAASDALGLKLGRRRLSIRQPPKPNILPGVIDISAARADAELEERNRLRDMAAQAIGLQPYAMSPVTQFLDESPADDADGYQETSEVLESTESRRHAFDRDSQLMFNSPSRSPRGSGLSMSISQSARPASVSRLQRSMMGHSPATTTNIAPIPPYPSTVSSLTSFRQCAGTYPKYFPPSSLRMFALSKNWKHRYLMMSSPATLVTRGQAPAVSYLHVFKSPSPDEKELERLEINEDSVVFVAEEEVGGKRSVIKVGGADVGAMKKEYMTNEAGYSMWLLHIQDTVDAQKWITDIKNAILGQRCAFILDNVL